MGFIASLLSGYILLAPATDALAQAKALYAEASEAIDAKDYATALKKFEQAYALAPDKHIFNYNIASAADLAGDCRKAQQHYQMFLDLVPEHPQRKAVRKSLTRLAESCIYDDESTAQFSAENRKERERERERRQLQQALQDAVDQTVATQRLYAAADDRFHVKAFRKVARARATQLKRMTKAAAKAGFRLERSDVSVELPATAAAACRRAAAQEQRCARAYAEVIERFDDPKLVRLMLRYERKAESRYHEMFVHDCP